jgi:DNA-binding protein H-NS
MSEHQLTTHDVMPGRAAQRARSLQGALLYQVPVSGATWSGRGRPPRWLDGKERELFRVSETESETANE